MAKFDPAYLITLKHEGGLVDHPNDPGGITKYGISKARYPDLDIAALTLTQAKALYYRDFWVKKRLGELNSQPVANMAFDMVVLHGQAVRLLQKALVDTGKTVTVDNLIGPETIGAMNSVPSTAFINNAVDRRVEYMKALVKADPKKETFLNGWIRRAEYFRRRPLLTGAMALIAVATGLTVYYWPQIKKKLS